MKKFKSIIACFILFAVAAPFFTACDYFKAETSSSTEVVIVIENNDEEYYRSMFDEFEKAYAEKGYTVNTILVGGGQVASKQDNLIASGNPPDIIMGGDVYILNQNKYLLPLDSLIEKDNDEVVIDDFFTEVMDVLKYNGKTYYLPEYYNTNLLYYNKKIFDEYNLDNAADPVSYPSSEWTYENFLDTALKLTEGSGSSYSRFGSYSTIGWWGEWLTHIRQSGGKFMDDNGYITLNTAEAIAGFTNYYNKMVGVNKVSAGPGEADLGGFIGKLTAMVYGGHTSEWLDYSSIDGLEWDIELLPSVNGNRTGEFAVNGIGIYYDTNAAEASWALLKYMTRKKTGQELLNHPYLTSRYSEKAELLSIPVEERKSPQNLEAAFESIKYNKILPQKKYFVYVANQIVQPIITQIIEGNYTIEEGLALATINSNKYIKANYI